MPKDYMKLLVTNHSGVSATCNGDTTVYTNIIWHDPPVTQATLDSEYLDYKKQERYKEIDLRTTQLISVGFTYDSNTFSLSTNAQTNWNNLKNNKVDFIWPVEVSTIDNNVYSLALADIGTFWENEKDAVNGHLDSGRSLKKSIFDAVDETAIDAVVDTR